MTGGRTPALARRLDRTTALAAITLACRAPSVHNTQPWRWRIGESSVHLFADPSRALPLTDPSGRDLHLSCGAALHHLQIALRAMGLPPTVHRLPDPMSPQHLAAVEVTAGEPSAEDLERARAIERRRTDRRVYSSWPVPAALRADLVAAAAGAGAGAELVPVDSAADRWLIARLVEHAAVAQALQPGVTAETAGWSGRHRGAADGVPAANVPLQPEATIAVRHFDGADLDPVQLSSWADDGSWLSVLATPVDDAAAQLQAGEALSAVLLEATVIGLASNAVTQPVEIEATRARIASAVLGGHREPQVLLRLGWAPPSAPRIPPTGRRPVADTIDTWDAPWS